MEHLAVLREWLASQKENWPALSLETKVSVKTFSRIVKSESYKCSMSTFAALEQQRAKRKTSRKKAVPA